MIEPSRPSRISRAEATIVLEHLVEVEPEVDRLARREQRRQLPQAVGEGRGEDLLLDQEVGESPEVELLLDRVGAEQGDQREEPVGKDRRQ
jgi:hypothetical protein